MDEHPTELPPPAASRESDLGEAKLPPLGGDAATEVAALDRLLRCGVGPEARERAVARLRKSVLRPGYFEVLKERLFSWPRQVIEEVFTTLEDRYFRLTEERSRLEEQLLPCIDVGGDLYFDSRLYAILGRFRRPYPCPLGTLITHFREGPARRRYRHLYLLEAFLVGCYASREIRDDKELLNMFGRSAFEEDNVGAVREHLGFIHDYVLATDDRVLSLLYLQLLSGLSAIDKQIPESMEFLNRMIRTSPDRWLDDRVAAYLFADTVRAVTVNLTLRGWAWGIDLDALARLLDLGTGEMAGETARALAALAASGVHFPFRVKRRLRRAAGAAAGGPKKTYEPVCGRIRLIDFTLLPEYREPGAHAGGSVFENPMKGLAALAEMSGAGTGSILRQVLEQLHRGREGGRAGTCTANRAGRTR